MNVRTNHAHAVVSIGVVKPERALSAFKANATRQMREDGIGDSHTVHGLTREAKDICGTNGASPSRSTMCSTGKEETCKTLSDPPATAEGTDLINQKSQL